MNEVKKVILFLLCCAIPFSFYAQKARQNAATKKWDMSRPKIKDGGKIQNIEVILCLVNGMRL